MVSAVILFMLLILFVSVRHVFPFVRNLMSKSVSKKYILGVARLQAACPALPCIAISQDIAASGALVMLLSLGLWPQRHLLDTLY